MRRLVQALSMLGALLLGIISAGAWWTFHGASTEWPIIIQQRDGNLALADETGKTRALTTDADGRTLIYRFPTPAPDGRSIAAVALRHGAEAVASSLMVLRPGAEPVTVYSEPDSHPFYLSWSPDSQKIAFLANDQTGMALHGVSLGAGNSAKLIAPGEPSYFAWSPNSQQLLLHIGGAAPTGSLQIYDWGTDKPRPIAAPPALFQTPHWLPDGQQALVVLRQSSGSALAAIDGQGSLLRQLAEVEESTVFVAAPDASHVAYLGFGEDAPGELHLLRTTDGNDRTIRDGVVTCFWSPRGDALAFLTLAERGETQTVAQTQPELRMRWNVLSLQDGNVRSFELFQPSEEFFDLLPFFDQYAQSIRVWNASGDRLIYATTSGVYTLDVASGQTHFVHMGGLGLWLDPAKEP